jgi:hypothetical protein
VLLPGRTRRGARTTGVPPLLASHAPSNAHAEAISTGGLPQRLLLGLRAAPMRATTTPANTEHVVTRHAADDGITLVMVPAVSVIWRP